jgi:hypothetical protein
MALSPSLFIARIWDVVVKTTILIGFIRLVLFYLFGTNKMDPSSAIRFSQLEKELGFDDFS